MKYLVFAFAFVSISSVYADCFDIHAPVRSPDYKPYTGFDCDKYINRTKVMDEIITSKKYEVDCFEMDPGSDRGRDRALYAFERKVNRAKKKLMNKTQLDKVSLENKLIELSSQDKICDSKGFLKINDIADIINESL